MYSIKRRLLLVLAAGFAVLIAGTAIYVESILRDQATAEFDAALTAEARALISLTEQERGQVEFDYDAVHMTQFEREQNPDLFQFWLEDGSPRAISCPAAESAIRVVSMPALASSQAVRRAPCRRGLVSVMKTFLMRSSSQAVRMTPSAVP